MHACVHWNVPVPAIVKGIHEAEDLLSHLTIVKCAFLLYDSLVTRVCLL